MKNINIISLFYLMSTCALGSCYAAVPARNQAQELENVLLPSVREHLTQIQPQVESPGKKCIVYGVTGGGKSTFINYVGNVGMTVVTGGFEPVVRIDDADRARAMFIDDAHGSITGFGDRQHKPGCLSSGDTYFFDTPGFMGNEIETEVIANMFYLRELVLHCEELCLIFIVDFAFLTRGTTKQLVDFITGLNGWLRIDDSLIQSSMIVFTKTEPTTRMEKLKERYCTICRKAEARLGGAAVDKLCDARWRFAKLDRVPIGHRFGDGRGSILEVIGELNPVALTELIKGDILVTDDVRRVLPDLLCQGVLIMLDIYRSEMEREFNAVDDGVAGDIEAIRRRLFTTEGFMSRCLAMDAMKTGPAWLKAISVLLPNAYEKNLRAICVDHRANLEALAEGFGVRGFDELRDNVDRMVGDASRRQYIPLPAPVPDDRGYWRCVLL